MDQSTAALEVSEPISAPARRVFGDITEPILETQYGNIESSPPLASYSYIEDSDDDEDFAPPLPSEAFKEVIKGMETAMQDVENLQANIGIEMPSMARMTWAFNHVRTCLKDVVKDLQEMEPVPRDLEMVDVRTDYREPVSSSASFLFCLKLISACIEPSRWQSPSRPGQAPQLRQPP